MGNKELLEELGIDLKHKTSGQLKTQCPRCGPTRKNKRDPSLSVDIDEGLYNCHHCDFRGRVFVKAKKEFVRPLPRLEKVGKKTLDWFENERKISNDTLLRMKISEAREWMPQLAAEATVICFNYYRDEQLVNIKFRGPKKSFKMEKDAELIFYNLDAIAGENSCIIVEGEIDCLTLVQCGHYATVSVPNGASKGNQKLEYLDNCWEYFKDMKQVILATDNDEAGMALREELARRIGKDRCFTVDYPEGSKDANDVYRTHGKAAVDKMITEARQWPLEGIMTMDDIFPIVTDWFENGYPTGTPSHVPGFDALLRFAPGQLTTITGIPGHGKDEFCNLILAQLAQRELWKIGLFDFEETPPETTSKLMEKITGLSFAHRRNKADRMTERQFEHAILVIDNHFFFCNTDEIAPDLDNLLEIAKGLVLRHGIHAIRLNPWNWIENNRPVHMSETEYVSISLSKIIRFARKYGVHVFLIAHTTKIQKDKRTGKMEIPNLYSIAGSANFYNKTHNGITVYKDPVENLVDVYVQKVKQSWLGKIGFCTYQFNTFTRQYRFIGSSEPEDTQLRPTSTFDFSGPSADSDDDDETQQAF
jgi:twinkle protein